MLHPRIIKQLFTLGAILFASLCSVTLVRAADLNISITVPGSSTPPVVTDNPDKSDTVVSNSVRISLSGLAYPSANLTFLKDGVVIGTGSAASDGTFYRQFTVDPGVASFGIWARDRSGLISPTVSFTLDLSPDAQVSIDTIALPPTIGHSQVDENGSIAFYGSAFPRSFLRIFNNNAPFTPPFEASVASDGSWRHVALRGTFNPRYFSYRANYQHETLGILSPFSIDLELKLETCSNSDFNNDGVVNLTDLSILLFYWGRPIPKTGLANACVDRNQDATIDLQDFSILMYEWTLKYELEADNSGTE